MGHWAGYQFKRRKGPFGTVRTCLHCSYFNAVPTGSAMGANSRAHWDMVRHIINEHPELANGGDKNERQRTHRNSERH
jgi:hypothetical protein